MSDASLPKRLAWAQLRHSIVGPLLSSPPEQGELQERIAELSKQPWQHPTARHRIFFAESTIARWYYQARSSPDPVAALARKVAKHAGTHPTLTDEIMAAARSLRASYPKWTYQLVHDNVCTLAAEDAELGTVPSYTTVRRWMREEGLGPRSGAPGKNVPGRVPRETRSYEVSHVGGLWHLDFHEGSHAVLTPSVVWMKPQMLAVIDDRSRLCCHAQWYLSPSSEALTHALSQAIMKRGLPRALMDDRGGAMLAGETALGLARLGIVQELTLPRSPEQNGKQESWWGNVEGRLLAMLPDKSAPEPLTLELLNRATQAWVELEYNRRVHSETKQTPLDRFLEGPSVMRPSPSVEKLRRAFQIEEKRRHRKSDGTISVEGRRYEVPSRYRTLEEITVRFARWDLSALDMIDARTGTVLCALHPLDRTRNADGLRRVIGPVANAEEPKPKGIAPLLAKLMADYAATGLPPAYLPLDERRETLADAEEKS
jgi:transposase InsO family protein